MRVAAHNDPPGVYKQRKGRIAHYLREIEKARAIGANIQADIYRPQCWELHTNHRIGNLLGDNSTVPLDWPHTLHALYVIRCNLFHGAKSRYSEGDARLVLYALQVLTSLIHLGRYITEGRRY